MPVPTENAEAKNPVYDLLVADPGDIESLVAYALYKKQKRAWAHNHFKAHGSEPTPEDDARFAASVCTDDSLQRYRNDAINRLLLFAESILEGRRPDIERQAIVGRVEDASRKIEEGGKLWRQILVAFASTIMATILLVFLTVAASLFGIDPIDGISKIVSTQTAPTRPLSE